MRLGSLLGLLPKNIASDDSGSTEFLDTQHDYKDVFIIQIFFQKSLAFYLIFLILIIQVLTFTDNCLQECAKC